MLSSRLAKPLLERARQVQSKIQKRKCTTSELAPAKIDYVELAAKWYLTGIPVTTIGIFCLFDDPFTFDARRPCPLGLALVAGLVWPMFPLIGILGVTRRGF